MRKHWEFLARLLLKLITLKENGRDITHAVQVCPEVNAHLFENLILSKWPLLWQFLSISLPFMIKTISHQYLLQVIG
jgi:hypothetical protein